MEAVAFRMQFPEVEIKPTDTIAEAEKKVERAFEARGAALLAFENLNAHLPTSPVCHFFQAHLDDRECVLIVMAAEWDEKSLLTVLNVCLNIRLDPDPPGPPPLFRFYGAHAVPPVLLTLFGDAPASEFECRAALVARFANDLRPSQAYQLSAVGMHLLRECFGVRLDYYTPGGEALVGKAIARELDAARFPEGGAPINSLIVLGFLFGEILRVRYPLASRWVRLKEHAPWPAVVFGGQDGGAQGPAPGADSGDDDESDEPLAGGEAGPEAAAGGATGGPAGVAAGTGEAPSGTRGVPQVVFGPMASILLVHQDGKAERLTEAASALEAALKGV
jgi:hypothetical protein